MKILHLLTMTTTNNTLISFKIDTGAQANVMLFRVFLNLQNRPKLQPFKFRLSAYNGTNIPVKGCCILRISHGITSIPVDNRFDHLHTGTVSCC